MLRRKLLFCSAAPQTRYSSSDLLRRIAVKTESAQLEKEIITAMERRQAGKNCNPYRSFDGECVAGEDGTELACRKVVNGFFQCVPALKELDPCDPSSLYVECAPGLRCGMDGVCSVAPGLGEFCIDDSHPLNECGHSRVCLRNDQGDFTCQPRKNSTTFKEDPCFLLFSYLYRNFFNFVYLHINLNSQYLQ